MTANMGLDPCNNTLPPPFHRASLQYAIDHQSSKPDSVEDRQATEEGHRTAEGAAKTPGCEIVSGAAKNPEKEAEVGAKTTDDEKMESSGGESPTPPRIANRFRKDGEDWGSTATVRKDKNKAQKP